MGLEIVEVIMRAEEVFDIEIPDEDAEKLPTVGAMYEYILKALDAKRPNRGREGWSDAEVLESLRQLVAEESSFPLDQISLESHLVHDLHMG